MKFLLAFAALLVLIPVACSASRSASLERAQNQSAATQTPTIVSVSPNPQKLPCTLKLAGAPSIKGLRLGMTRDEVLAQFPSATDDPEVRNTLARPPSKFGTSDLMIRPGSYISKDKFAGINQISFTLLDGRVYTLNAGYNGPHYKNVDEFVRKFGEGQDLPAVDQWDDYVGMENSLKVLKCDEFEVNVFIGGEGGNLNYVLVKDLVADKVLKGRRAKAKAQASPTPNP